ncbi:MAG: glycosyltransferase [Planctomycetota bacterium]|jgi:glycosyltransferase involved in cell wall biosynthesis|nr:glycosyltransferase [Planctomycetota bacterium]
MTPLVSIVIPVYNGSGHVREAIASALAQTCRDVEILVINDGSTDGGKTREACLFYGDRIRYFEKENAGVSSALNFGIERMRGEYFSWLSHDDAYFPDKLERQVALLRDNPGADGIVIGDYDFLNAASGRKSRVRLNRIYPEQWLVNSVFTVLTTVVHGCTPLIHRAHFERTGLFDRALHGMQDHDMWFRLFRGRKLLYSPSPLATVRLHALSGTNTMRGFTEELGRTYMHSALSLGLDEVRSMFPSASAFYYKIVGLLLSYGCVNEARRVGERAGAPANDSGSGTAAARLRRRLDELAGGEAKRIVIFGLGRHGRRLLFDLSTRRIPVAAFIDNDPAKWGRSFHGVPCLSPETMAERGDGVLTLAALRDPDGVMAQLADAALPAASKQDLDALLLETPPSASAAETGWIAS